MNNTPDKIIMNDKNNKVSILTVVYNGVGIIEETILSVLDQSYNNIEYIIIDGGSTDGTLDIIKKYESKLSLWVSEPDKGIYDAMNKGVSLCNGDWLLFMNCGDSFYDKEVLTNIFKSGHENSDVIYGAVNCFDKFKEVIIKPDKVDKLNYKMIFCHQSSLVRRNLLLRNPFDLNYKIAADYNLFYNLYTAGSKFTEVPLCIANYEVGSGISSRNGYLGAKDNLKINKRWGKPKHMIVFYYQCLKFYTLFNLKRVLPHRFVKSLLLMKYKSANAIQ